MNSANAAKALFSSSPFCAAMAGSLKTNYPNLKILFTSGHADDAIAHHGVLDPGVAFLPKPFTPSALAHKLREVLDQPAAS